jgi:Mg2+-importing ATPase
MVATESARYWTRPPEAIAAALDVSLSTGLSDAEAAERLRRFGPNDLRERRHVSRATVLARQFRSPLLLLLVFAAGLSLAAGEWIDAAIVLVIVIATTGLGYAREYSAHTAALALGSRLHPRANVLRQGRTRQVPSSDVVPGDVIVLAAGALVPADGVIVEATDFFVSEAALTGESYPVRKAAGITDDAAPIASRTNCVFHGTNVRSGSARCLVVATGGDTEYGGIAHRLLHVPPETDFDRGLRHFGYLLTSAMLMLVLAVFAVHVMLGRPPAMTLLFAVALAVGLSPELLPAILSVNLARGAQSMARGGVLVRRLNAIENLGCMDVLCTDKTGTLTEGVVRLDAALDDDGQASDQVLALAAINAGLETGIASPLDEAITVVRAIDPASVDKRGEVPFDFVRKRVTVALTAADGVQLITKGAFDQVLAVCADLPGGRPLDETRRDALARRHEAWSRSGMRVLALATRTIGNDDVVSRAQERDMTFRGFLTFLDRTKPDVVEAIADLSALGVAVKLITGDNRHVARHVAQAVGLRPDRLLTGAALDTLHEDALWHAVEETDLFVEVDPHQKERVIRALRRAGHVVGFLGDGINDAPAMHAADTSLSVDQAVDVAREAADFVLLERGLDVIRGGIEAGRRTFANTLKYVLITTSANLGNMLSMAAASLVLPFLPLTAGQILLNNFLSDVPAVGIADDAVDPEQMDHPRRWDIRFIGRYMLVFGAISSVFDLATFVVLLRGFHAGAAVFRTGWFVESLLTELVVVLVMRTERPAWRSRPGGLLVASTIAVALLALVVPYLPAARVLGFVPVPGSLLAAVLAITVGYAVATEVTKRRFYRTG